MAADRATIITNYRQRINEGKRTKLNRTETQALIDAFIADLKALNTTEAIKQRCEQEITLLEEGYPQLTLSSRLLPAYRKALHATIEAGELPIAETTSYPHGDTREHAALTHLKYDQATYERLRHETIETNNARQDQLQPVVVTTYLTAVEAMLSEQDPYTLTAAIAAASGRRHTEVVARGTFTQTSHPYILHFSGQQKKREASAPYDILTLIPAATVLSALTRLRQHPAVTALADLTDVNDSRMRGFNVQVNRVVKERFEDTGLVPRIAEASTVSIHRLRGVYGAIAIYLWCPPQQHESRFLQHYLGHEDNSGAIAHYQHYRLLDAEGNELRQKGVLLKQFGALPETDGAPAQPTQIQPERATRPDQAPIAPAAPVTQRVAPPAAPLTPSTPAPTAPLTQTAPAPAAAATDALPALADQARTLAFLAGEIEVLRRQLATREQAEEQARALRAELSIKQAKIDSLESENKTLRRRLERFENIRVILSADDQATPAAPAQPQSAQMREATPLAPHSAPTAPTAASAAPAPSHPTPLAAATSQPAPDAPAAPTGRRSRASERAARIWQAIQEWNNAPDRELAQKILISPTLLEREFGVFRPAIKQFMQQHAAEIAQHNQRHGLHDRPAHNRGLPPAIWETLRQRVAEPNDET